MIGDVLKKRIAELSNSSNNKRSPNAFWIILRDIAKEEIINYGGKIDSDEIIPIYYDIMSENLKYIPSFFSTNSSFK